MPTRTPPFDEASIDPATIKGVFFDLGGTLFTYHGMPGRSGELLVTAAQQMNIEAPPEAIGKAYQEANRRVAVEYGQKAYYLHADLFRDVFVQFCNALGGKFDDQIWDAYRLNHDAAVIEALAIRTECTATMKALRAKGLYLSIASNIDHQMLQALVERDGLDLLFNDWTSSEEAKSCKPDGAFFDYTREKSGLEMGNVLFVGDSPEHDILGAHRAGMKTALLAEPGIVAPLQSGKKTVAPDCKIDALSDLLEILT